VQYKQQSRLGEKRKKAMDMHLSFIVDQTEKYSSWLTEGLMANAAAAAAASASVDSSASASTKSTEQTALLDPDGLYRNNNFLYKALLILAVTIFFCNICVILFYIWLQM